MKSVIELDELAAQRKEIKRDPRNKQTNKQNNKEKANRN